MSSNGFLFAEPSISDVGVWCELNTGIDPAEWAFVCRHLGKLSPREFDIVVTTVKAQVRVNKVRAEELFDFRDVPLVSIGCSGMGGEYQREL